MKLYLCTKMGWTEQEYNSQRAEFVNDLYSYFKNVSKEAN